MKNYIQEGVICTLTAPYAVTSGQGAQVGVMFGVAAYDVANGAVGEFLVQGVCVLPKTTSEAWAQGAALYWNNATKAVTTTVSTNIKIGIALIAAQAADTSGTVRLNGSF